MIRVSYWYRMLRYFTFRDLSYFCLRNEYNADKFNGHMQCSECRKSHFRASNFKNFPGGHAPGPPELCEVFENATVRFLAGSAPEQYGLLLITTCQRLYDKTVLNILPLLRLSIVNLYIFFLIEHIFYTV